MAINSQFNLFLCTNLTLLFIYVKILIRDIGRIFPFKSNQGDPRMSSAEPTKHNNRAARKRAMKKQKRRYSDPIDQSRGTVAGTGRRRAKRKTD